MPKPRPALFLIYALALPVLGCSAAHNPQSPSAAAAVETAQPQRVFVSNEDSDDISVIDAQSDQVVATIFVGKRPRGLRLSPDGKTLYVAVSGSPRAGPGKKASELPPPDRAADGIAVVDIGTSQVVRVLPSGQDPESFDLTPDGRTLFVSNEETAQASVVDLVTGRILRSLPTGAEPEGVATRPDGKVVYVTSERDSAISVIDTATRQVVATFKTPDRPRGIAFTPDGSRAFITAEEGGAVAVVDARAHRVLQTIHIDGEDARPMGAVVSPDGKTLYVTTGRGGFIAVIDVATARVVRQIPGVGERPWGIAITADGRKLYTANGYSNDVSVVDAASGQVLRKLHVGSIPWGVTISRSTR